MKVQGRRVYLFISFLVVAVSLTKKLIWRLLVSIVFDRWRGRDAIVGALPQHNRMRKEGEHTRKDILIQAIQLSTSEVGADEGHQMVETVVLGSLV